MYQYSFQGQLMHLSTIIQNTINFENTVTNIHIYIYSKCSFPNILTDKKESQNQWFDLSIFYIKIWQVKFFFIQLSLTMEQTDIFSGKELFRRLFKKYMKGLIFFSEIATNKCRKNESEDSRKNRIFSILQYELITT